MDGLLTLLKGQNPTVVALPAIILATFQGSNLFDWVWVFNVQVYP